MLTLHADMWREYQGALRQHEKATGLDKIRVWLAGPEALEALVPEHAYQAPPPHDDATVPFALKMYVLIHGAVTPALLGGMIWAGDDWSWAARIAYSAFLVATVVIAGGLLERKPWAPPLETARLLIAAMATASILGQVWPLGLGLVLLSGFAWCATQERDLLRIPDEQPIS